MKRYQVAAVALSTETILTIRHAKPAVADRFFIRSMSYIKRFEQQFSRFRPDSETTQLNIKPGQKVRISPLMHQLLSDCVSLTKKTNGLFNPMILPALQRAGYVSSKPHFSAKPDPQLDFRTRQNQEELIELGQDWATIPKDSAIDFGGIGKGFLLDRLSELAEQVGISNYWFSLGGDIIASGADEDGAWRVEIEDVLNPKKTVTTIELTGKTALATSGTTKRRGITSKGAWHHLIDPRLQAPAQTARVAVTAIGQDATSTDVGAKTAVLLTNEELPELARGLKIHEFIIQQTIEPTVERIAIS